MALRNPAKKKRFDFPPLPKAASLLYECKIGQYCCDFANPFHNRIGTILNSSTYARMSITPYELLERMLHC